MTQSRVRIIDPPEATTDPEATLGGRLAAGNPPPPHYRPVIHKKQISVRREKALCFSGCDSRPASKRSSRKESERSVEVTTLPKPLV